MQSDVNDPNRLLQALTSLIYLHKFSFPNFPIRPYNFPIHLYTPTKHSTLFNCSCGRLSNQSHELFFLLEMSLVLLLFILHHSCCSEQFFLYSYVEGCLV